MKAVEDLVEAHEILSIPQYLRPREQGPHDDRILDQLIYKYPKRTFLALFRVQIPSFWKLVERVT